MQRKRRTRKNEPDELRRSENRLMGHRRRRIFLHGNEGQSQRRGRERLKRKRGHAEEGLDRREVSFNSRNSETAKVENLQKGNKSRHRDVRKRNRKSKTKKSQSHCSLALNRQSGGAVSSSNAAVDAAHESSQLRREI
jgi:hypothetical protein